MFRVRRDHWPPVLRTATAAVAVASAGNEVLYSIAAADPSGQFCVGCPTDTGWLVLMFSFFLCGGLFAVRLHRLRLALDSRSSLGSAVAYAPVLVLAAVDGDLLVWLPWLETNATRALAGFPDGSSIAFTTWCILLRKVPFLAFTAMNAARSGASFEDALTLVLTGASLVASLSIKYLRRLAFSTKDLSVYVGVRGDAARSMSSGVSFENGSRLPSDVGIHLGNSSALEGLTNIDTAPLLLSSGSGGSGANGTGTGSNLKEEPSSGYVGVAALPESSSESSLQTAGAATMGLVLVALVVTGTLPSVGTVLKVGKYILFVAAGIVALVLVCCAFRALYVASLGCCRREMIRSSVLEAQRQATSAMEQDLEAKERDLEAQRQELEAKERDLEAQRQEAEAQREEKKYMIEYAKTRHNVDLNQVLPHKVIVARLAVLSPRVMRGIATKDEDEEADRLYAMLDANPETKKQDIESRAAFLATQQAANAEAARILRSYFHPASRFAQTEKALVALGVSPSAAKRFIRTNALRAVLTPKGELSMTHFTDLASMNAASLSLLELRAFVGSLPEKFESDTAKGEKQDWAKGFVEALRTMLNKKTNGLLQADAERHPCYNGAMGPFDPSMPLERREAAVKSAPMSGAAAAKEAAVAAAGRVAERQAALREAGLHGEASQVDEAQDAPIRRTSIASGVAVLRGRRSASTEGDSSKGGNALVAAIAAATAARNSRRSGGAEEF